MSIRVPTGGRIRGNLNGLRATEHRFRRYLWQRWHNPAASSRPAFLVGCGRSGTSMIVRHLSKSWRIELYNEDNPAVFERWRIRDLAEVSELVDRSHAQIVLFKPILDTNRIRIMLTAFPGSKAIFSFRHYDDVINSSLKRFGAENRLNHIRSWINEDFSEFSTEPPPEETKDFIRSRWKPSLSLESGAALYWLFYNRLYFDLRLDQDERVKLACYESVVANPLTEFEALSDFLGLEFEPKIAAGIFSSSVGRNPTPDIDSGIRADCEELWRQLLFEAGDST